MQNLIPYLRKTPLLEMGEGLLPIFGPGTCAREVLYGRLLDSNRLLRVMKKKAGLESYIRPVVRVRKPAGSDAFGDGVLSAY